MNDTILQGIGYCSTVVVLISFLMASVKKLRIVNTIGSGIFIVYALLIRSYPTALLNLGIVVINIYYLVKMSREEAVKKMYPVSVTDSYLKLFLQNYKDDIETYFPDFRFEEGKYDTAYFVSFDMLPAGLAIGNKTADGALELALDYSIPSYRDCSVGKFLHDGLLLTEGFSAIKMRNPSEKHVQYLADTGFVKNGDEWIKK